MAEVASRELRNDTRSVLRRVEAGEQVFITVDGRAVAQLRRLDQRATWLSRDRFLALLGPRADPALSDELADLLPDTTEDVREW
jgi:antitoxin (DNA-binding transcriptional repressor) of toxin-antitoxin stability system